MVIWVFLDRQKKQFDISADDIVFCYKSDEYYDNLNGKKIYYNKNYCDENTNISDAVNLLFLQLPEEWSKIRNSAYDSIFRPVVSIVHQLSDVINEHGIDKIILLGGSKKPFITLTRGEGEGSPFLYHSSWLFNCILYQYFLNNTTLKVEWNNQESTHFLSLLQWMRELLLTFRIILAEHRRYLIGKRYKKRSSRQIINESIAVPVMLNLQVRHLSELLKNVSALNIRFVVPYSVKLDKNFKYDHITIYGCSFDETMSLLRNIQKVKTKNKFIEFRCDGIQVGINVKEFARSITPLLLQGLCYSKLVEDCLNKGNYKFMVTDMTFGIVVSCLHEMSANKGIKHFNFQYVSMNKLAIPDLNLADRYYCYSRDTFEFYKQKSNSFLLYMPILIQKRKQKEGLKKPIISIFIQPDAYSSRYYKCLQLLFEEVAKSNIDCSFIIKPHYRQNDLVMFEDLANEYEFTTLAQKDDPVSHILDNSDIMMSMTSSVLFEAVSRDVPGIILDIDGQDSTLIDSNDNCVKEVNKRCYSIEDVLLSIKNVDFFISEYESRREKYLSNFELSVIDNQLFY